MERWQSTLEHDVGTNLSESGVEPLSLGDLLGEEGLKSLLGSHLGYPETRGSHDLRAAIASLYPGCSPENVLATTGSSEANLLVTLGTAERGSPFVTVLPNYLQVWGVATSLDSRVEVLKLRAEAGWQPSEEEAKEKVGRDARAISFSNPNNPTGVRLTSDSRKALTDLASDADAWILSDEVYTGAEREGDLTPSLWGDYEKVLVTGGLSKAFGLSGLRLGWVCGPREKIEELWSIHDYTTIAITKISEVLGTMALTEWRERLWSRARSILQSNLPILERFVVGNDLSWVPPEAGAIAFLKYPWDLPSTKLAEIARERDVLVVPGSHFGHDGYLRLGYGMARETLDQGLRKLEKAFRDVDSDDR